MFSFEVFEFSVLGFLVPTMEKARSLNIQCSTSQVSSSSLNVTLEWQESLFFPMD